MPRWRLEALMKPKCPTLGRVGGQPTGVSRMLLEAGLISVSLESEPVRSAHGT